MTTEFFPEQCKEPSCNQTATLPSGFCSRRCYQKSYLRQYQIDNRDKRNARLRDKYATDPEFRKGLQRRSKKYLQTERGQTKLVARKERFYTQHPHYHQQYHIEHAAQGVERTRLWREANPERARELARVHARARRKHIKSTKEELAEIREWQMVISQDPCVYCGCSMEEMDHIHPIATGGQHLWDNLTSACKRCNANKNARSLLTYLELS